LHDDSAKIGSIKMNWKILSDIMDNDQSVLIIDNKGDQYQGKIISSDHRALFIKISKDENKLIFHRNIVNFKIIDGASHS